jgi:hypothetical protein
LTEAQATLVAVPALDGKPPSDVDELLVAEIAGKLPPLGAAPTIPVRGTPVGDVFLDRTPRRFDNLNLKIGDVEIGPGSALLLPLRATDKVAGVLVALRHDQSTPFSQDQEEMMAAFADQAALAWQLASSQRLARELDVLADRDRIARDLHDHVIQRLFAVGLALQGTIPRARSPEVQQRLSEYVDDLQAVIEEIRTTIFDLHGPVSGATRLRQRLDEAIAQFADGTLHITTKFIGPLSVVDATLADHAEAVVREAVSNAVRHAHATTLAVTVKVEDELSIEVLDNGRGMSDRTKRSGWQTFIIAHSRWAAHSPLTPPRSEARRCGGRPRCPNPLARCTYAGDSRATMTGIRANWATVSLTEPTSISANPPRPRLPTTSSWVSSERLTSSRAG